MWWGCYICTGELDQFSGPLLALFSCVSTLLTGCIHLRQAEVASCTILRRSFPRRCTSATRYSLSGQRGLCIHPILRGRIPQHRRKLLDYCRRCYLRCHFVPGCPPWRQECNTEGCWYRCNVCSFVLPSLHSSHQAHSRIFKPLHPPGSLNILPEEARIGLVDPETIPQLTLEPTAEEKRIEAARATLPHPSAALNLDDIEALAYQVLTETAWAYYSSAGDDEQST